jgi:hypothetical protein
MALNVPDVGENIALEALVNKTAPQNLVLRLYSNNITPSDTDVAGTYTEATFAGYGPATLTGGNWNAASGGSITYGSQQTFTRTSTGATENIYGYFVMQSVSGILVYSERDASAPFAVTNANDAIRITPVITAN